MSKNSVAQRIESFNLGRDPKLLTRKYKLMQDNCFAFLRGTAHLFYEDWPRHSALNDAPLAWVCGDLHLQNFGTYKGDNRLTYFDINDFDEAVLAPCTWDLARFATSLLISSPDLELTEEQGLALCADFLDVYERELLKCKAQWIERATATGIIKDLMKSIKKRSRAELLDERTFEERGGRKLKVDVKKTITATEDQKRQITQLINSFAKQQSNPEFFEVLDVARRISGLSSLGLSRYIILINGKGKSQNYLLDLKLQTPSALAPYVSQFNQPNWASEAERTKALQSRGQAVSPAFLHAISDNNQCYLLKELMPQQDRLDLELYKGEFVQLQDTIKTMAELVAWLHIRTGGWRGSATSEQWQNFAKSNGFKHPILEYALHYSKQVQLDWQSFKTYQYKT